MGSLQVESGSRAVKQLTCERRILECIHDSLNALRVTRLAGSPFDMSHWLHGR